MKHLFMHQGKRLAILAACLLGFAGGAQATYTRYHSVTVNHTPTGAGLVYLSEDAQTVDENGYAAADYQASVSDYRTTSSTGWPFGGTTKTMYVYAKPQPGYLFTGWTTASSNTTINNPSSIYTSVSMTATYGSNRRESSPAYSTITAQFAEDKGMVKVATADARRGSVSISKVDNVIGDVVTISATPLITLQGVKFLYWTRTEEGGIEETLTGSTQEMSVTATGIKTTYTAYFSEPVEAQGVYCRLRNVQTGQYLSLTGDKPLTQKTQLVSGEKEVYFTTTSLVTVAAAKAVSDPSTVFFLSGVDDSHQGLTDVNLRAQGVDTRTSVTAAQGSVFVAYTSKGYRLGFSQTNDGTTYNEYLQGKDDASVEFHGTEDDDTYWAIEVLDEDNLDDYYFGVTAKSYFTLEPEEGQARKYYTTLYTGFPYRLMDDVQAYYIEDLSSIDADNRVTLTLIPTGSVVPAQRAVVLECPVAGNASRTRLLPVVGDTDTEAHLMGGTFNLNGETLMPSAYASEGKFYVLSVNSERENMAFYNWTQAMPANKAFVVVPNAYEATARQATLVWGEGGQETAIEALQISLPKAQATQAYDLTGRKVSDRSRGIQIVNGKKTIGK